MWRCHGTQSRKPGRFNYVFGVKGRDVTYVHEDNDAGGVCGEYSSRTALVDNWAEFADVNTAVSTSRLSIAKACLYDAEVFCPAQQWQPYVRAWAEEHPQPVDWVGVCAPR